MTPASSAVTVLSCVGVSVTWKGSVRTWLLGGTTMTCVCCARSGRRESHSSRTYPFVNPSRRSKSDATASIAVSIEKLEGEPNATGLGYRGPRQTTKNVVGPGNVTWTSFV
jgi:hypothetical protein